MRTASRKGERSQSLVEDLRQETYVKLLQDGCRHVRDFAIQHPEAVLGYVKKIAHNVTLDHFRQDPPVSTIEVDPVDWKADPDIEVLLKEINEYLKHCLTGPDQGRDRMIFWLYFRQGMSTKEIASLPIIGLTAKGVGSVIERLKHGIREQIVGSRLDSVDDEE